MFTPLTKKHLALSLVAATVLGSALTAGGSAHADPKQYTAAVGVGSDTVQDVFNAFAGSSNGTSYLPINSGAASSFKQVVSFDATNPSGGSSTCITAKLNGPTFTRPNGSGAGRKALYAASGASTTGWTGTTTNGTCATAVDISGQVDFARSSSVSSVAGTAVTYLPFGRDGVSFGYYRKNGAPVTTLTRADLLSLFSTGPAVIGGVRIVPCGIQTSSGTYGFWNTATGASATNEGTSTQECNNLSITSTNTTGRAEENDGTGLKSRGDALAATPANANDEVIIGFSAASFIAKTNLVAPGAPPAGVGIGAISDDGTGGANANLGSPFTGTGTSLAANPTFYASTIFGRNVYTVLPTSVATGTGNASYKALFVGPTSAVCSATSTISTFGFLPVSSCGSTTQTSGYDTAAS